MSMTDPISDMLTRIRNGSQARFSKVDMPLSKMKLEIAKILKREGYIKDWKTGNENDKGTLRLYLKYDAQNRGIITGVQRVSKPSRRVYVKSKNVPTVLNGYGVNIVSTSQGVVTDHEARKMNLGGELLCSVW